MEKRNDARARRGVQPETVREHIYEYDAREKKITGKTLEVIEEETGIPREIMFPPDEKILYIGDPWQRMGMEIDETRMICIDYEFAEEALFNKDQDRFRKNMQSVGPDILRGNPAGTGVLTPEHERRAEEFKTLIQEAHKTSLEATKDDSVEQYPRAAEAWERVEEYIRGIARQIHKEYEELEKKAAQATSEGITEEDLDRQRNSLDYMYDFFIGPESIRHDCGYARRGFRDIYDYITIIRPKLEEKERSMREAGQDPEDIGRALNELERELIEKLRLRKRPAKAGIIKAMHPYLPIANGEIGSVVCSWSISAHLFPHLDQVSVELYDMLDLDETDHEKLEPQALAELTLEDLNKLELEDSIKKRAAVFIKILNGQPDEAIRDFNDITNDEEKQTRLAQLAEEAVENVDELLEHLKEIERVLKPGGEAFLFPINYKWMPDVVFYKALSECGLTWDERYAPGEVFACYNELPHILYLRKAKPLRKGELSG